MLQVRTKYSIPSGFNFAATIASYILKQVLSFGDINLGGIPAKYSTTTKSKHLTAFHEE